MSGLGFGRGIVLAALLAVTVAVSHAALTGWWPQTALLELLSAGAAGAYVLCLVAASAQRAGRIALPLAWLAATLGLALLSPGLIAWVVTQALAIWVVRTWCCHDSVLGALLDLALSAAAVVAAGAAARTSGSVLLAVWSFFLVQACHVAIPQLRGGAASAPATADPARGFERAHARASAALGRLRPPR